MKLITTTTNNLEGWSIKEYLQPISSNIVVGANIFSDFSASITDFFGGRSGSYEKKLQQIYDQSISNLQSKAKSLNANAIIGLKIDLDEISGKGTQMFMITAYGTPVMAIKLDSEKPVINQKNDSIIDGFYVQNKVKAKRIIESARSSHKLDGDELNFVLENPYPEFIDIILEYLKRNSADYISVDPGTAISTAGAYFANLDQDIAIQTLYNELYSADNNAKYYSFIEAIIKKLRLIDYPSIKNLMTSDNIACRKFSLSLLSAEKAYYSQDDVSNIKDLKHLISETFNPLGVVSSKKGFMSGEKDIWTCSCSRTNNMNETYCSSCRKDIYGFKDGEIKPAEIRVLIEDRLSFM